MAQKYDRALDGEPTLVRWSKQMESATLLDPARRALQPVADLLVADPARRDLLQGMWLGHAVHPMLTDIPLGSWTSATVLDLLGGRRSRPAADLLVALGVVTAVPTAVTGMAEWGATGNREQRVGVVHATANTVALGLYTWSLVARRRGRHARGVMLALAGGAAATVGGYLGGHLTEARKVSTSHPAYATDGSGPQAAAQDEAWRPTSS